MEQFFISSFNPALLSFLITTLVILAIWELIWKGIALWNCGRNNQLVWFICILILNTAGILPIIYLLFFKKKASNKMQSKKRKKRR